MGEYHTAQICLNGHLISDSTDKYHQHQKKFCDECGEETIMTCQNCKARILGHYHVPGAIGFNHYTVPKFCYECGYPYPWTERKSESAKQLVDFSEQLKATEKEELKNSIDDIIANNANVEASKMKYKKYIKKAGKEMAEGTKNLLIGLVSESVKKGIWGE